MLAKVSLGFLALALGGCIFGGNGDRPKVSTVTNDVIATCGAGVSVRNGSALKVRISDGIGVSITERMELRAAFLDSQPDSDITERVVKYTEYLGCVTNEAEREFALSEILERKIKFTSHMAAQGLSKSSIRDVERLYDEQYSATQNRQYSLAAEKHGGIAVRYFKAVQSAQDGQQISFSFMPPPSPPAYSPASKSSPPPPLPTVEQIRAKKIAAAKVRLQSAAATNSKNTYSLDDAQWVCRQNIGYFECLSAYSEVVK
ncbi:hypothetical protein K7H13_03380 [Qipengyuania citrea]|uniref:hypothetical protein n=1 Tax=Qipengyuania citrea TaxID=225971 RepID=UPI001E304F53|nr:hypothetical protein [Qipengyuania citrea]MCD1589804.1 hypothetical protein [Qipengyuania citrea]